MEKNCGVVDRSGIMVKSTSLIVHIGGIHTFLCLAKNLETVHYDMLIPKLSHVTLTPNIMTLIAKFSQDHYLNLLRHLNMSLLCISLDGGLRHGI